MEIHFITSNAGKAKTLQSYIEQLGRKDIIIKPTNLDILEPQADTVAEVSLFKAKEAHKLMKGNVLVEDGGFSINALGGFPGVYTKYAISTLKADGFIRLMAGVADRSAKFISTATYIDEAGNEQQFHRKGGEVTIADKVCEIDSPFAWSGLWKIIYIEKMKKVMAEMDESEVNGYYAQGQAEGSLNIFANWLVDKK